MRRGVTIVVALLVVLSFAGCAAGPNEIAGSAGESGKVAGFWLGLWHGFIVLITFVVSLFSDKVQIYEVHNNGGWYNFGYLIGVMSCFGGGGGGAGRRSRRR
jgi:hypothetical protein